MKRTSFFAAAFVGFLAAHVCPAQCPQSRVVSPTPWERASFGHWVQVSGDVAVVADPADDSFCSTPLCSSGAVHVFRKRGGEWQFDATLYHARISEYDAFGTAGSMDGPDRFAASAPAEDVAGGDTGAIYIFEHNGEAWHETAEILPVEPVWSRCFACALALQGDTLVAGQRNDACWVYRERSGRWEFDQKIPAPPSVSFTWFSDGLTLDGEWLVVGAPHDNRFALRGGVVHLYRRDGEGAFEHMDMLAPPDPSKPAGFGTAVALEKDRLVIGAPFLDSRVGAAFIYELADGRWELRKEIRGDSASVSSFGESVAIGEGIVLVGAPGEPVPEGQGAVYAFRRAPGGDWLRAGRAVSRHPPSAGFARSLATDGATIIAGAPDERVGGAAHIFDLPCLLCRADLDGDGQLTFFDFLAFQNLFAAGDPRADFDGDGVLTFFDFLAFQNEFAAGCA
jgi:hypothetical protein